MGLAAVTSRSLTRRSGARSDCPSHDSHQLVPLPPLTLASMRATTVRPRRPWIMLSAAGRFTASPCSLGATPHDSERLRIRTCVGVWVFARVLCVLVLRFPCACFCAWLFLCCFRFLAFVRFAFLRFACVCVCLCVCALCVRAFCVLRVSCACVCPIPYVADSANNVKAVLTQEEEE